MKITQLFRFTGHSSPIYSLTKSLDKSVLFSSSSDGFIASWNFDEGKPEKLIIKTSSPIYSIELCESKNLLLAGNVNGEIHIVDLKSKTEIKLLKVFSSGIFCVKCSEEFFCATSADGHVAIGFLEDLEITHVIKVGDFKVRQAAFDKQATSLFLACGDGTIAVFDLKNHIFTSRFIAHNLSANCVLSVSDKVLVSGGRDAHIKIWHHTKKSWSVFKSIPAHNFAIYQISYNPTLKIYATVSRDKTVKLWDENFEILARLNKENYEGHLNSVNTILWANDYTIASAGDDRSIIIWKIQ